MENEKILSHDEFEKEIFSNIKSKSCYSNVLKIGDSYEMEDGKSRYSLYVNLSNGTKYGKGIEVLPHLRTIEMAERMAMYIINGIAFAVFDAFIDWPDEDK